MAVLSRQDTGRLLARTVAVPDPGDLLAQLPQPDVVAWVHRGAGLAGWGEAARVTLPAGEDRFTAGEKWLRSVFDALDVDDQVRTPGSGPVAFGTFTFDASSEGSVLIIPRAVLGRDGHGLAWLTTVTEPGAASPGGRPRTAPRPARAPARKCAGTTAACPRPSGSRRWRRRSWRSRRASCARSSSPRTSSRRQPTPSTPVSCLQRLAARYPECYTFACDGMIGATPELLIRQAGRQVSALVLAGTAPRGGDPAEDEALGAGLLASAKDTEEHAYAVASMRDALGPLCDALEVEARPALLKLPNLHHLGTWVRGTLAPSSAPRSALGLAAAVHPTAAVCGTPTGAAFELIRELEHMDRERYAGPVGWVDAEGNGEWGIALRCAQLSGRTARLFAGCGIVAGSDPAAELAEAQVKFRPMRGALES